ncbi:MAG: HAMP domain-containing sensor histidine kinase [Longimicrobiales bacterium]|nr:HAMP domain-containing sensor histidine kinase [Longimicrobiales bacterium]
MGPLFRRRWPWALAVLFVALLVWYLVYTERIVRALRADAAILTEIYSEVQGALADPSPGRTDQALFELQRMIIATGVPLVQTGPGDTVIAVRNLPFEADPSTPEGQARLREYVEVLDSRNPPVGEEDFTQLHFGDPPEVRRLRWIPWLQAGGLLLTVLVGYTVIRFQRRAESERAWTAMARELAHQLGTPLSSLQGWLEFLRMEPRDRPSDLREGEVVRGIEEDLVRLERISRRFELIGREPELESVSLAGLAREMEDYLQVRLPRFGSDVELAVRIPDDIPPVKGNRVLLAWALENVVKNALDALAGRGGRITIYAREVEPGWVALRIKDTGPGVGLEVRDTLFEAGTTTKAGGWGVGLALARRIVEGVHDGQIRLLERKRDGATFEMRLPTA